MSAALMTWLRRAPHAVRGVAILAMLLALGSMQVSRARALGVFAVRDQHARALLAGRYLEARMPDRSVVIAGEQSGALRYYTTRSILRWDVLTPESLGIATSRAVALGHDVWVALDEWEEGPFRAKFGGLELGTLDWPPALDAGVTLRTRAWRASDRARQAAGQRTTTDRLR
jgi:hypothetical protein